MNLLDFKRLLDAVPPEFETSDVVTKYSGDLDFLSIDISLQNDGQSVYKIVLS